jgi:hypothetical protein
MPPAIPNYDLGLLITLDIGLAILGLLMTFFGIWAILKQANANTAYLADSARRVAEIAERIDARLRRDFPDIGGDLGD